MNFTQMMEALKKGYYMRRPIWASNLVIQEGAKWIHFVDANDCDNESLWLNYEFDRYDFEATDWEIA